MKTDKKVCLVCFSILFLVLNLFGAVESLNKFSIIRDEVLNYTPIYTKQYGINVKGIDYGVGLQGGHIPLRNESLSATSRKSFSGNNLLGYKNSETKVTLLINGAPIETFPLQENWESGPLTIGNAKVFVKLETKELPVLPRIGMDVDNPIQYQNAKVFFITYTVDPLTEKIEEKEKEDEGWFDPTLRYNYETQVRALKDKYLAGKNLDDMSEEELEKLAREMNKERRDIGIRFKNATPEFLRKSIYERNMKKYGDKYGPTISYLRNVEGKSWKDIIRSSSEPGGGDLWYITYPSYELGKWRNWFSEKIWG